MERCPAVEGQIALRAAEIEPASPLCIDAATRCRRQKPQSTAGVLRSARPRLDFVPRKRLYFVLMGTCLTLIVLAWFVVRLFSTPIAIAMSVVALVIPPVAAMIGNRS